MAHDEKERDYSDDEIEQILGMGGPESKLALDEMRKIIRENPLLVGALIFSIGILVGASLHRAHRRS